MMFDTDVLIWAMRKDYAAAALVNSTADRNMSVITLMELLQGVRSKAEMKRTQQSLVELGFRVLPLTERIGHIAVGLLEENALAHGLQLVDAMIAATAVEAGEMLATANVRHFRPIRKLVLKAFRP